MQKWKRSSRRDAADRQTAPDGSHVRLLGCGTALNAALIGQQLIERLARIPAVAHVSSEFRYQDPVVNPEALHFAVSQSGETMDTIAAIKEIQLKGGDVHGVVNVVGSTIARLCGKASTFTLGPNNPWRPPKPSPTWWLR